MVNDGLRIGTAEWRGALLRSRSPLSPLITTDVCCVNHAYPPSEGDYIQELDADICWRLKKISGSLRR